MLVKRPILVGEDVVLVGFKENEWEKKPSSWYKLNRINE
jgi:arsenate reductase-like glutaredoxin family protein